MSGSICAACQARIAAIGVRSSPRLLLPSTSIAIQTRRLHSTPPLFARPKSNVKTSGTRESRAARLKKKPRVVSGLPQPGQRREEKRRIVLSNTSALSLPRLQDLGKDNMTKEEIVGKVLAFREPVLDQLRAVEAFQTTQKWSFFARPATLIREETRKIGSLIREVTHSKEPKIYRRIYSGGKATGKSVMLAQAQALAFMNDWVVISIPEGMEIYTFTIGIH